MNWFSGLKQKFDQLKQKFAGRSDGPNAEASEPSPRAESFPFQANSIRSSPSRAASLAPVPRFHSTASDQLAGQDTSRFAKLRMKLRTAYTPAQPITDPWMFAGRTGLLTSIIRAVEDQRLHVIIYGERGIGKTSLLQVLMRMAREARYLVAYVSCGATADFDETFRTIAAGIPLLFHEDYGPTSPEGEMGNSMADFLPAGNISPRLASQLCAKVTGTRVLVVLDEFDRAKSADFRRSVAEFLKNLSDSSVRVQLVIAGVAANLEDLLEPGEMLQRNVIAVEVPQMEDGEVQQLVEIGQNVSGLTFDDRAMATLKLASHGLPYLASLLSQQAGLEALLHERLNVAQQDVMVAIDQALEEIDGRIPRRTKAIIAKSVRDGSYVILGPLAGRALYAGGDFSLDDLSEIFPDRAVSNSTSQVEKLLSQGIFTVNDADTTGRQMRFADRNGLLYLWLLGIRARLQDDTPDMPSLQPTDAGH